MKTAPYLVAFLGSAILAHALYVRQIPTGETERNLEQIQRARPSAKTNRIFHGKLRVAGKDTVVRDNPDTVTSFADYDVSQTPVRMHCVIPSGGNYWSVSFFAMNTDNFYVVNDRTAPAPAFDLVIVREGSDYKAKPNENVLISPSNRGVIIVRMIVTDRDDAAQLGKLAEEQRQTTLGPI